MTAPPRSKREYLQSLVQEKNQNSRALTEEEQAAGFLGWHERGVLPHCDFPGLIQLVTFRLADSMPSSRRGEWEHLLRIEDVRERRTQLEEYLDCGCGECWLRNDRIAQLTEQTLLHFQHVRYDLLAWCVMPNHVHLLVHVWRTPLWKLIRSWKQYIATHAEDPLQECRPPARPTECPPPAGHEAPVPGTLVAPVLDQRPALDWPGQRPALRSPGRRAAHRQRLAWQREYWDTYMRDERQERAAIHYIESNPVKGRLCRTPEDWPFSSARFRDEYRQLQSARQQARPIGTPTSGPA